MTNCCNPGNNLFKPSLSRIDHATMPGPHLTLNFLAFSAIGLFALWGIVLTNGTLPALIEAVNDGFYPNGLRIHLRYTGIARVDHVLACLVAFFHIRVIAREGPPIMMVLEVAATLLVINLFILTESRRKDSRSCLKLYVYMSAYTYDSWQIRKWFNALTIRTSSYTVP